MGSSFIDKFGYRRQRANPISRTGVFPYTGEQIDQPAKDPLTGKPIYKINPLTGRPEIDPKTGKPVPQMQFGLEPKKLYPVLRGPEELFNKDAIDSFNGLPIRIGHLMLGETVSAVRNGRASRLNRSRYPFEKASYLAAVEILHLVYLIRKLSQLMIISLI